MEIQTYVKAEGDFAMSLMQQGILQAMSGLENFEDGSLNASFIFPESFAGFQGHFEGNPVLPGVCKIQAVIAMHEKFYAKNFRLKEVAQAKYFLPVTPHQKITVKCSSKLNPEGALVVKATVQREEEKVALLQMIIQEQK